MFKKKKKEPQCNKHRMHKVSVPIRFQYLFPALKSEELNENVSNANVTLFPSVYILNKS